MADPKEIEAMHRVMALFREMRLTQNDGWLTVLGMVGTIAVSAGMTKEETLERVAKQYDIYSKAYGDRAAKVGS